jgi:signal transduction histidine kinase/ActR/RegA family two-component response regulator
MPAWLGYRDWSLRGKIVALLVAASLLPLGIATWISVHNASTVLHQSTGQLLQARAQMLARRIDAFNEGYTRIADLLARSAPSALSQSQGRSAEAARIRALVHSQLRFWTEIDPGIRGVALLDATGTVAVGTEPALEGSNLARYMFVRNALGGTAVISDIFLAETPDGDTASIGYLAPVRAADGKVAGAAAIWVNASYLTQLLREVNDASGPGSFATLVDSLGIRVAHSTRPDTLFHPVQELEPADIEVLVAEQRFGARTRELLSDVMGVRWDPPIDYRKLPDIGIFQAWTPDGQTVWLVGQRCTTVPWMVFHTVPTSVVSEAITAMVRSKLLFGAVIMLLALVTGLLFAHAILRPVRKLEAGADAFGAGELATRVAIDNRDELGRLGATFNNMAARIQEQSAALLRESADQHRKLFQTMTEAFCTIEMIFDEAGHPVDFVYLETNHEFEAQSGLRDVVGKRKTAVVPELPDHWMQLYGRVARTGEPVDMEEEEPGTGRHFHVRAYRVGGADSNRVAVLFNDITERRLAEQRKQAQLESLSLLHRITRAIGERQDLPSIFQVVLRSIEDQLPVDFACICSYEAEHGRLRTDSIGTRSLPTAQRLPLQEGQYIAVDANGLSRWAQGYLVYEPEIGAVPFPFAQQIAAAGLRALVAAPLQVESRVFGVLIAARRTTGFNSADCEFLRQLSEHVALAAHHAQLYGALQQAYRDLRETQQAAMQQERLRALGQMASGIAHDINNNISPVTLYTDSILEREAGLSEQGRRQLLVVQRAIHDVAATVTRMREFYREREPQLLLAPVQLNELVPQVVELTRARWGAMPQQRGVTIQQHTELQPDLPAIMGAESEIREALTNLLFNAVDAMPGGGVLTLRTATTAAGQVMIEVRDTGVGMDEDARRRCLEPFFTTKGERGTGLGLAMVYGMTQRHSADIQIDSAPGQGTCVRLIFAATTAVRPAEAPGPVVVPRGQCILVIDDDPVLLRTLCEIMVNEGHTVVAAGGGQEGIDAFAAALAGGTPFTLVFTDLGMPQVDGRQVARAVKARSRLVPVIMLTGWGERMVNEGDVPADVDLVLSKPPKLRTLREALAQFCGLPTAGSAAS